MKTTKDKEPGKRRLRRYVADPEAYAKRHGIRTGRTEKDGHTAGFQLTDRDREILRMVLSYRYVTVDHIHALIPGNNRQNSRRVQAMFHLGYLTRYLPTRRLRVGLYTPGSEKMIYGLDTAGWRELETDQQRAAEEAFADTRRDREDCDLTTRPPVVPKGGVSPRCWHRSETDPGQRLRIDPPWPIDHSGSCSDSEVGQVAVGPVEPVGGAWAVQGEVGNPLWGFPCLRQDPQVTRAAPQA